ncbi:MAG: hypothetical protein QXS51_03500 [Thermoproteota archaeon]|nr:hypothetical protein [Candidatus Brockarchaeota archaeon]
MPSRVMILLIAIITLISAFSVYRYYNNNHPQDVSRSERISLLMSLNLTDRETAILFDDKYSYMAVNGSYNQTVLEFFSYWCLNQSLAEECLNAFKNVWEANNCLSKYYERPKRILFLIEHANATESEAEFFDREYSYLATGTEYNQTVLKFFNYWRVNNSLASLSLSILQDIEETNSYLSQIEGVNKNFLSKEDLTLILAIYTDKEEYSLTKGEELKLTVTLLSSKNLGDVNIEIFGFKSRHRGYVVNNKWIDPRGVLKIPVQRGFNSKTFSIDIPCSPCYGIQSGLNNLTCVIKYGNLSLSVTKSFLLKSES